MVMQGRLSQRRVSRFLIQPGAPVWNGCWIESQWLCQCVHHDEEAVSTCQGLVQGEVVSNAASWDVLWLVDQRRGNAIADWAQDRLPLWLLHRHLVPSMGPTTVSDTRVVPWQLSVDSGTHYLPSTAVKACDSSPHTPRDCLGEKPGKIVGMRQIEQLPSEGCALFPEGGWLSGLKKLGIFCLIELGFHLQALLCF